MLDCGEKTARTLAGAEEELDDLQGHPGFCLATSSNSCSFSIPGPGFSLLSCPMSGHFYMFVFSRRIEANYNALQLLQAGGIIVNHRFDSLRFICM
jgi:hypothetical protein